jgi:hypothetical protein
MPTIDDILNKIGVTDNSSPDIEMEKQAAALGLINQEDYSQKGENMNLQDFYDNHFQDGLEKNASYEDSVPQNNGMTKEAGYQVKLGSLARDTFDSMLLDRLIRYNQIKLAMSEEGSPESAASQAAGAGPGVIPGSVGDPRLATNRPSDAAAPMDLTPVQYNLGPVMDAAVEKARLEQALAEGNTDAEDVRGTSNSASGMAMPAAQG